MLLLAEAKRRQEQDSAESSTASLTGDLSQAEMPGSSDRGHNGTSNEAWGTETAQGGHAAITACCQ